MDVLWPQDVAQWCSTDFTKGLEVIPFDEISNDDEKSSSYRSGSVVSGDTTKSRQRSRTDLSVLSQSNGSCYSRFSRSEQVPSAQSEGRILDLLAGSGYPMTQVNGQRKLGPPPGWTKPPPEPECEIFVGKIPRELHEDTLYPIFSSVGQIYEIRLMMDFSGSNRGYCFIMFTKVEYAQRAIKELNNFEIRQGHKIGVVASINNCRLCIGQLPAYINSEIVITVSFSQKHKFCTK
ncbi:probable RNA-binding protein 46 [Venturia canescens]|uniref:probable RNA-binding protein 46 n=1 Tax=Venturia canescens TaxID=32260 RepID=UPI001C9BF7E5|nr:probable RNA-binding protein 46 [Venturia canescens]